MKSLQENHDGAWCHLLGLSVATGIPLVSVVLPLVIWVVFRTRNRKIADEAFKVFDFNLTMMTMMIVVVLLVSPATGTTLFIVIAFVIFVLLASILMFIGVRANGKGDYVIRAGYAVRLLKS